MPLRIDTDVFKNTRLAWLTRDAAEDYAMEDGAVNRQPVIVRKQPGGKKKMVLVPVDPKEATQKKEIDVTWIAVLNAFCFPANALVTYFMGVYGYILEDDNDTIEVLSTERFPTIVSPDHWVFNMWHVIFAAQLLWLMRPLLSLNEVDKGYLHMFGRSYLTLTLLQVTYYLSFTYEILWLSVLSILCLLVTLLMAFQRLYSVEEKSPSFFTYMQWIFPFTIHLGWILMTALYQVSLALAYTNQLFGAKDELNQEQMYNYGQQGGQQGGDEEEDFTSMLMLGLSLVFTVFMSLVFAHLSEFVVPSVVAATFLSMYFALEDPHAEVQEIYSDEQINIFRYGAVGAGGLVTVWTWFCIISHVVGAILNKKEMDPIEKAREEDAKAFDSASDYVAAPEQV